MRIKVILDYDGQKKLYERYNITTLDSLETVYDVLDINYPIALKVTLQKKYEDNYKNNEDIDEYYYSEKLRNFNISEIIDSLSDLSDEELKIITDPIFKAISSIKPEEQEIVLIPKLIEYQKAHTEEIEKRITPIENGMLLKDIKNFFLKFGFIELENFDRILNYYNHKNINDIKRVKNEALKIKHQKYIDNSVSTLSTIKDYELTKFQTIFNNLTDRELEFLYILVGNASMNLESIQENKSLLQEISKLLDLIEKEKKDRFELNKEKQKNKN